MWECCYCDFKSDEWGKIGLHVNSLDHLMNRHRITKLTDSEGK